MYNRLFSQGKIRPEDLEPNIEPFIFYWEAFIELSSCRNGMGMSPIPFTAIVEYSKIYEVEDFFDFLSIIRIMDSEIIKLEAEKTQSKANKNGGKTGKGNKGTGRR